MRVAVLALQGAFVEHERMLQRLGIDTFEIRRLADWQQPKDGLIIPGGESTVMLKLLNELQLFAPIREAITAGLPVFGTCAGMILLAREVENDALPRLATMNMTVRRNAYGRQLGSFFVQQSMVGIADSVPMTFIRAPYIVEVGSGVDVLAHVDGHMVAARQGHQLVTAFHPELNDDPRVHQLFVEMMSK